MRIIFLKDYIDALAFDRPVIIETGTVGLVIDESNGIVEIVYQGNTYRLESIPLSFPNSTCALLREDVEVE